MALASLSPERGWLPRHGRQRTDISHTVLPTTITCFEDQRHSGHQAAFLAYGENALWNLQPMEEAGSYFYARSSL